MGSMKVDSTKHFRKQFKKLTPKIHAQFDQRLALFLRKRSDKQLHDHALTGKYKGYRSINITGDIRALYYEHGGTIIIFAFIGSHSQLYG